MGFPVGLRLSYVPALRCASCLTSYEPPASGPCSSSLRSSSTRAVARVLCAAGSWRLSVLREIKVNGASGGPGSGKEGVFCPAGCLLGGEARLAVPLAWHRRQPGTCRERNRRRRSLASPGSGCRRLHSRQNPGRATPARRGEQPTSAETCALHIGPGPTQNRASETPSDPGPPRPHRDGEISPQTNHPTRTPRGNFTLSALTDPRRKISPAPQLPARTSGAVSPQASGPNLATKFPTAHPTPASRGYFTPNARPLPQGEVSHRAPSPSRAGTFSYHAPGSRLRAKSRIKHPV